MKLFALGFIFGVAGLVLAAYLFLITGQTPVATSGPPLPLERWVAHQALKAAMKDETFVASPLATSEENLLAGAKIYLQHCAVCHGRLKQYPTYIAKGLFPKPPQLLEADDQVTDDPIGKIYWKVKNGIRLTGMPGFTKNLSEKEMWQVSEVLLEADKLPETVKAILSTAPEN